MTGDVFQYEREDFCRAGLHTGPSRYQRLSQLQGLWLAHSTNSWKVYIDQ